MTHLQQRVDRWRNSSRDADVRLIRGADGLKIPAVLQEPSDAVRVLDEGLHLACEQLDGSYGIEEFSREGGWGLDPRFHGDDAGERG